LLYYSKIVKIKSNLLPYNTNKYIQLKNNYIFIIMLKKSFSDKSNDRCKRLHLIGQNSSIYINKYTRLNYSEIIIKSLNGIILLNGIISSKLELFELIHKYL
jgi:hypothetical protein